MSIGNSVYIFILIAASLIAAVISVIVWRRRRSEQAVPFLVIFICISYWSLMQALMFISNKFIIKLTFANLRYFAIEIVPIAFFALAYEYKNKGRSLSLRKWIILLIFPFVCLVALWSDPYTHLFYSRVYLIDNQLKLASGPGFWIDYVYLQLFMIYGIILFIITYLHSYSIYRKQARMIAISAFIPNATNLAFNLDLLPFKINDVTPITFFVSGILLFYAIFQYKLFDIVPVARDNLIESMNDMVIVLDNRNRVLDLNLRARELTKRWNNAREPKSFIGMGISDVFTDWKELVEILEADTGKIPDNKRITYSFNGVTKYFHISLKGIFDKKKYKNGRLIVLRDITTLEEALNEAKRAKDAAEYANRAKGYFLANMSHEIRTPMNAIIGISDILYSDKLDSDTQKEYIRMITESAQSLLLIINNILDYSKIEVGKMVIENVNMNLKQLVSDAVRSFIISSDKPDLNISCNIGQGVPDYIIGDPVRLGQILINIVGNAVKFTERGSITVDINEINRENKTSVLEISVTDTGIGIPQDQVGRMFESFSQLDGSITRKYGGTGLGLAIVKNLVQLMNGEISVESESGKGSRFICKIPFDLPDPKALISDNNEKVQSSQSFEAISKLRILVAEDNRTNQELIKIYLKKAGCRFEFADNGSIALEMLDVNDYDIVLMDVQMPVQDGLEATARIREKEKDTGGHIPIIALTAGAMEADIEKCLEAGMDRHISKPVKASNLYSVLEEYGKLSIR